MRNLIYCFYHLLQKNEFFLTIISWLQQHYVTVYIGDLVNYPRNFRNRKNPDKYLSNSRAFFANNSDRIAKVMNLLSDEQSRICYKAAIKFRTDGRPIKRNEWSLTDQYFVKGIITLSEEVFIDGGAYNGDTIDKIVRINRRISGSVKKVIAFEPNKLNAKLLKKKYSTDGFVSLYVSGLGKSEGISNFISSGSSSKITSKEKTSDTITICAIDDILECSEATFIKMDIEGAEWDALHGAEKTIKRNKPKLAICIYHSDEDMIRIAEYIHKIVPDYNLYIRQHTRRNHETVLYAIV